MRVPNHVQLFILLDFSGHLDVLFLSICGICALQDLRTGRINMVYSLRQQGTPYFLFAFLRSQSAKRQTMEDKVPLCRRLSQVSMSRKAYALGTPQSAI